MVKVCLKNTDIGFINRLERVRKLNFRFAELMSRYLNLFPRGVTADCVSGIKADLNATDEEAVCATLSVLLGLDTQDEEDRIILRKYLPAAIKCLHINDYNNNPYYKTVCVDNVKQKEWELKQMCLLPYEGVVYNDPVLLSDYTEIPCIGFFKEKFSFPAVLQNGREWMTLMPNETATLEDSVSCCFGNVLTYGLGLGYFPFMASAKDNVKSVTIVEKDKSVIELFKNNILPHFPNKEKINIICEDAFFHAEKILPTTKTDYVLADIWHDAGDGLPLYLRFRKLSDLSPNIVWDYWLEETIINYIRPPVFSEILSCFKSGRESNLFEDLNINSRADIEMVLSREFLWERAYEIGEFFKITEENI